MQTKIRAGLLLACGLVAIGCGSQDEAAGPEPEATRKIMGVFFDNLRVVLPLTVDEETFRDPMHRAEIRGALTALAANASALVEHIERHGSETRQLGQSLERDTDEILRQYERRHYVRSAFLLQQVTENCVVCHSRLPSPNDSTVKEPFIDDTALMRLAPDRRATLQIATRQFDSALITLEALLAAPESHPALMLGPLTDYLTICLRVKDDYARPVPVLAKFAQRPDLWLRLRADVAEWIAALPVLHEQTRGEPAVATAQAILTAAADLHDVTLDPRGGLAHAIAASAVLQRYVEEHHEPGPELALAYFLLGEIEARIGRNFWVTQATHYLTESIRLDPAAPTARDAYALLEEEIRLSYEGSDWEQAAGQDAALLKELRALIEGS